MKRHFKIIVLVMFGVFCLGIIVAGIGMGATVGELSKQAEKKTPNAILASAGMNEERTLTVPVEYFDQKMDECVNIYTLNNRESLSSRQFEWSGCGYHNKQLEKGLVEYSLNDEYLPVAVSGKLISNRGLNMDRWFKVVEGESARYAGTLEMKYEAEGAEFSFWSKSFYPLDDVGFSNDDVVNKDGHNHLFTMSMAIPFMVLGSGEEKFEVEADDDTFVFVGDKLVLDMGGVHDAIRGEFIVHDNGEIYAGVDDEDLAYSGVNLKKGEGAIVRIFHADRDSKESEFGVRLSGMKLSITNTELAGSDNGIQVAYDPSNPTYIAPLGESLSVEPDSTKGLIIALTIEGFAVVIGSVLMVSAVRLMIRAKK